MTLSGGYQAVNRYRQMGEEARALDASPHQLVQMMLDGALGRIAAARGAMESGAIASKGALIGKAIGLIDGLRGGLNLERGGEIAANLSALYAYMGQRLLEANLRNDAAALDEVAGLLKQIRSGWEAIGPAAGRQG
jgi:flagellar protein FliS